MKRLFAIPVLCTAIASTSQPYAPARQSPEFRDTYLLKPPSGTRVAVSEFEDLECPKCGHDAPLVHSICAKYNVPLMRKDYPWFFHAWAMDAALNARYLQDRVSPHLADSYRADVFAAQNRIASRDDLRSFTGRWYTAHQQTHPFAVNTNTQLMDEVRADHALGDRIGVHETPTIFVVTESSCLKVPDATQLDAMVKTALQQSSPKPKSFTR